MAGRGNFLERMHAVLIKEFIQLRRDRLTFAMLLVVPLVQLTLFGYAINNDPKHLPAAVVIQDDSTYARDIITALEKSGYFAFRNRILTEREADLAINSGHVNFVVTIPPHFGRDIERGAGPQILVEADASDPSASGNAVNALPEIIHRALLRDFKGPLTRLNPGELPFELVIHRRYNPEGITQYNIVPGLLGVILTFSLILMTALSVTRETERGTMENLLAMPVTPAEVMAGKILPYIGVGMIQVAIILLASRYIFHVPMGGAASTLAFATTIFVAVNLAIGYTFSTLAKNQMQAMQMTIFFILPSVLLSGFMFPYRGMPHWAQYVGEALPLTHFLRVIRGILLKGNGIHELWNEVAILVGFMAAISFIAVKRFRRTLD